MKKDVKIRKNKRMFLLLIPILIILASVICLIYLKYEEIREKYGMVEDVGGSEGRKDQVVYKGETYRYNYNRKNILVMGIDQTEADMQEEGAKGGNSDFMLLISLDRETQEITMINIPRDTMAQVKVYNMFGDYEGLEKKQITLAYAYGEGGVLSANLASDAVSKLFYGIQIDRYYAFRMDGISMIHQICGDVTVTLHEKIPGMFPNAKVGDSVVIGENEIESYLRYRDINVSGSSLRRLKRQSEYLVALGSVMSDVLVSGEQWSQLYEKLSRYMVTNISVTEAESLMKSLTNKGIDASDIVTIEGEMKATDKYDEYHVDEDKLYQFILDTFYQKIS